MLPPTVSMDVESDTGKYVKCDTFGNIIYPLTPYKSTQKSKKLMLIK